MLKLILKWLFKLVYRVEVTGLEHLQAAGPRALIVANHNAFIDGALLGAFLPGPLTFAINTQRARVKWLRPFLSQVRLFPMDPTSPLSLKSLIRHLESDQRAVIFPEGRISTTGALMKIYDGPGMVADRSAASIVPVRIEGAERTLFARKRMHGLRHWFARIRITVLPAEKISLPVTIQGRERRRQAGQQLQQIMTAMMYTTSHQPGTLFASLLKAKKRFGARHTVLEDILHQPMSYASLLTRAFAIGDRVARFTQPGEYVGVLLPTMANTVAVFMGLQSCGRVPAMLNYSAGSKAVQAACETAQVKSVLTSRRFIEVAKLHELEKKLAKVVNLVYLEDLAARITLAQKLKAAFYSRFASMAYGFTCKQQDADSAAVVLFTSGSEGTPKGVVLSHNNLLANARQLLSRVDFSAEDIVLNALPLFHSFGLSAGTLMPLCSGIKTFFYPSPLHYRMVPEMAYESNATIMFGTSTFLAGYARHAHPYDFHSIRYVFAGAEKLHEETRRVWAEKFGIRILEGYGATETSPVLAANTPMENRVGTVGRLLPGIDYHLEPVPGVSQGQRLHVRGANIMRGYLLHDRPGELVAPESSQGSGWYDTGDIVTMDQDGFITICGRAKRFAKIGGEMVSLTAVEELAAQCWPEAQHAVVALVDTQKGEQLVLLTTQQQISRNQLVRTARESGIGEINVPKLIISHELIPLLGSGKIDYQAVSMLAANCAQNLQQAAG